jgi:hypothetical protein
VLIVLAMLTILQVLNPREVVLQNPYFQSTCNGRGGPQSIRIRVAFDEESHATCYRGGGQHYNRILNVFYQESNAPLEPLMFLF